MKRTLVCTIRATYDDESPSPDPINKFAFERLFNVENVDMIDMDDRPSDEFDRERYSTNDASEGIEINGRVRNAVQLVDTHDVVGYVLKDHAETVATKLNEAETGRWTK